MDMKGAFMGRVAARWIGLASVVLAGVLPPASVYADVELQASYGSKESVAEISDLEFLSDGSLLAADKSKGHLIRIDGGQLTTLNVAGKGQVFKSKRVSGVAALPEGLWALSNSGDDSIVLIDTDGAEKTRFGTSGSGAGLLKSAVNLSYSDNDRLYVADESGRVSVFSATGVFLYSIGDEIADEMQRLKKPIKVKLDNQERVYVLDSAEQGSVHIFSQAGKRIKRIDAAQLRGTTAAKKIQLSAMDVDASGRLFIADEESGKILQYDWQSDKVVRVFGSAGKGPGQFKRATALAVSEDNRIAVADSGNEKIDVYQLSGQAPVAQPLAPFASVDFASKQELNCNNAYELNDGRLLCLDSKKDRVSIMPKTGEAIALGDRINNPLQASFNDQRIAVLGSKGVWLFDTTGQPLAQFGASGKNDGELKSAQDIYLTDKRIYIAESGVPRVQFFSHKGVFLGKLPRPGDSPDLLQEPAAVAVNAVGEVFVADNEKRKIVVFSANNQWLYEIGAPAEAADGFTDIIDLALDVDDNLYVLTGTNQNEQSVHVYKGKQRLFRFGNYSKKSDSALSDAQSITITPNKRTTVAIFDGDKKAMLNYHYLKVPAKVSDLQAIGNETGVDLQWTAVPGNHIQHYKIYGSRNEQSDFAELKVTEQTALRIEHGKLAYPHYRVSAVSGFEREGVASAVASDQFLEAYQAYQAKDYATAEKLFSFILEESPDYAPAIHYLGLSYRNAGKQHAALSQFASLSQLKGYESMGLKLQVETLYEQREYVDALSVVQQLIQRTKDDQDALLYCGRLSLEMNDAIGAVECLEKVVALNKDHIEAQFLLGEAYLAAGADEQGWTQMDEALKLTASSNAPRYSALWSEAGRRLLEHKRYDDSVAKFEQAIKLDSGNVDAQLGLAETLMAQEQYDQVRNRALALAGQEATASAGNYLLGLVALKKQQEGQALLAFAKATRTGEDNIPAWLALAGIYENKGELDKAKQTLAKAATNNPNDFDAQLANSKFLLSQGDAQSALPGLKQCLGLRPHNFAAQLSMAQAQAQTGALNTAQNHAKQAIRIQPESKKALLILAGIQEQQGKTADALATVRKAIELDKNDASLQVRMAQLYLDTSLYDQALAAVDKALAINPKQVSAYVTQGDLYLRRRLYDAAIESYEKALAIDESADNKTRLNTAFAEKKKSEDFRFNQPQLVLENLQLNPVFSAAYKQYADKPVGSVVVRNAAATDYGNLSLSFNVKGYMDFPTSTPINMISGGQQVELPLTAAFNNKVLGIDEDTGVQVEIKLNFVRNGQKDSIVITRPMTIHGKNAITWSAPNMVGSFVTPKDDAVRSFVRQTINQYKPPHGPLSESLVTAMTLFDSLKALGVRYVVDPSNPFAELSDETVDYVQFARETLKLKSGDCDDLSVLLSTSLENVGIETALLDVPGHLLMMFNTGIPAADRTVISQQEKLVVIRDGMVWVPVEATMVNTSFSEAWAEGARKYHRFESEGKLAVIPLHDAWKEYQPVTLAHVEQDLPLPPETEVRRLVKQEIERLVEQGIERIVRPYKLLLASNPKDEVAQTQMAIAYAKYGMEDKALEVIDDLLQLNPRSAEAYNTMGNVHLQNEQFDQALAAYQKAEDLDADDGGIKINMAIAYYRGGEIGAGSDKYQEAIQINANLAKRYEGLGSLLAN